MDEKEIKLENLVMEVVDLQAKVGVLYDSIAEILAHTRKCSNKSTLKNMNIRHKEYINEIVTRINTK